MSKSKQLERIIKETIIFNRNNGFWFSDICILLKRKYNVNFTWYFSDYLIGKFYPIKSNGITIILYNNIESINDIVIIYGTNDIRQ